MNKSDNRFCVYIHIRPDTGAVFYVGIGLKHRPYKTTGRNKLWNNIFNKNKGNVTVEILINNQSWQSSCQMEKALIKFYGRKDKHTGILCNLTDGGDGACGYQPTKAQIDRFTEYARNNPGMLGRKHSVATKEKIRSKNTGQKRSCETRLRNIAAKLGTVHKESTKEKLRFLNTGKIVSDLTKCKMRQSRLVTKDRLDQERSRVFLIISKRGWLLQQVCPFSGMVLNTFLGAAYAAKSIKVNPDSISAVINRYGQNTAGGFFWRKSYDLAGLFEMVNNEIAA